MMTSTTRVAVLGTGTMGFGMAQSLRRAGLDVRAWNRSVDKALPLQEAGALVFTTPAEAVAGADVVITMLFDIESVLEVMDSVVDSLRPGAVWVQSTTVGPAGVRRCMQFAGSHHIEFLDAPVLGTKEPAARGELKFLVSGDEKSLDVVRPALTAMGSETIWVDETPGESSALKLVVNTWIAQLTAITAQTMAVANALTVDPRQFLDAIRGSQVDCGYAHIKGGAMAARYYPTQFTLDGIRKDVELALDAAGDDANTALLTEVAARFAFASDIGHGDQDMAAVYESLRAPVR